MFERGEIESVLISKKTDRMVKTCLSMYLSQSVSQRNTDFFLKPFKDFTSSIGLQVFAKTNLQAKTFSRQSPLFHFSLDLLILSLPESVCNVELFNF